jgi:hypothetical protein
VNQNETTPDPVRQGPSCACGSLDASWHGDEHGRREYSCDDCAFEGRKYLIEDADGVPLALQVTWADLAAVNDPWVMAEVAEIALGERTILGQCDEIERVS